MEAAGAGAVLGIAQTVINNQEAAERAREDRRENYKYGEMAADNADRRTRALYGDFYSPAALKRQYQEAGLSPSLMFGGTPGQGGTSGAQGSGASGIQTQYMPLDIVNAALGAAQIANIKAQTKKTEAETGNIQQDTVLKQLQETWQEMQNNEKSIELELSTIYLTKPDGTGYSLYELANESTDYDDFVRKARRDADSSQNERTKLIIGTEYGQKVMRRIYMDSNRFERDIKVLSEEGVSANFQKAVMQALQKKGFAEQNAEVAIKQMAAAGEAADLTKEQKAAWNNIIEKLRRTNSTAADIAIVAAMVLNQGLSHWNIHTGKK